MQLTARLNNQTYTVLQTPQCHTDNCLQYIVDTVHNIRFVRLLNTIILSSEQAFNWHGSNTVVFKPYTEGFKPKLTYNG